MAAGDVIGIEGKLVKYTYISIGIKGESVRSGMGCNWRGKLLVYQRRNSDHSF